MSSYVVANDTFENFSLLALVALAMQCLLQHVSLRVLLPMDVVICGSTVTA